MSDLLLEDEHFDPSAAPNIDWALWRQLFRYILPYKRELVFLIIAAIITGVLEPVYALITKWLLDDIVEYGADAPIMMWATFYVTMALVIAGAVGFFLYFTNKLRVYASYDLRIDAFSNLQQQSFAYFDKRPVGWLVARLTSDCERLTNIVCWALLDIIWGATMILATSFALAWLSWKITLVMLLVMPFIFWVSAKFQRSILGSAREVRAANSRITGSFNEGIMGMETSKVFVQERTNARKFSSQTRSMYRASVRNLTLSAIYVPIIVTASSVSYGLALAYGGSEMLAGSIAVTTLITFMMLVTHFFEPFELVGMWFAELQMAQASAERVLSIIQAEPEIKDSTSVQDAMKLHRESVQTGAVAFDGGAAEIKKIELLNVGFGYDTNRQVLSEINLTVEQGQTIALVGPTGGGKTTLVNVICRFYEPTRGGVYFDGVDYRNRSQHWLHSNLGIVLQQAHVFSGTVRENIRYGKLDATDREVEDAAKLSEAHEFISGLERGYDTEVGEGGNRLSAGEKQLLSFARAILASPQILVLDEATSSVDSETEQRIQHGIERMLTGRISFIIAHRLTTIRNADRIVFIDDGHIVEMGSHEELLQSRGRYFELYAQQSMDQSFRAAWQHESLSAS